MKKFSELFDRLDQTKSTLEKVKFLKDYFLSIPSEDAAWAAYFLMGNKIKSLVGSKKLFDFCLRSSHLPAWIIVDSYSMVGDVAETISLIIGKDESICQLSLSDWIHKKILPLKSLSSIEQEKKIVEYWSLLDKKGIFILNKILTGSLRVGISHLLTIQALSLALDIPKEVLSLKLMGQWEPSKDFFQQLKSEEKENHLNPYPFYLASPLTNPLEDLGEPKDWQAEWKWDGIRAQIIKRNDNIAIWSRGNELITHQFPELVEAFKKLKDVVIDGEIIPFKNKTVLSFAELQKRLGRKKVSKEMLEAVPVVIMVYDLLEYNGKDIRDKTLQERRSLFEKWNNLDERIKISPLVKFSTWEQLKEKRLQAIQNNTEGLILKKKSSKYGIGRRKGNWWKFKIDPKTVDAILIYAQPGQGSRANLYTDLTFGVFHGDEIVPIAKAYSGLTQNEIIQLDKWIRKNTLEKFGPVRRVKPELVFEIAFEGIQKSNRHKSGIAFRFPRINRWRHDKPLSECDKLDDIKKEFLR